MNAFVNENEVNVGCDVDGTLVRLAIPGDTDTISIRNPYDGIDYSYVPHWGHVDLLRQYAGRGFYNIVWSAGGVKHAESVVEALGLNDGTVKEIMTKVMKVIDDKDDMNNIVGVRVFIPEAGF